MPRACVTDLGVVGALLAPGAVFELSAGMCLRIQSDMFLPTKVARNSFQYFPRLRV